MNFFQSFRSPQQFIQGMINNSQVMRNPMAKNAIGMAQNGNTKGIEQMARNLCREKGVNPEEMINQVKNRLGM